MMADLHFLDESPQELYHFWVIVVDAEIDTEEQAHVVCLNELRMIADYFYDF